MKTLCGFFVFCSLMAIAHAEPTHYLLVLEPITPLRSLLPDELIYTEGGVSLVKLPFSKIEKWTEEIHKEHRACGGFVDVTEEAKNDSLPERIVWRELDRIADHRDLPLSLPLQKSEQIAQLVSRANADLAFDFLTELSSMPDRSATTEEGKKATEFLKDRAMKWAGHMPGFQVWSVATENESYSKQPSTVATLPGLNPDLPHVVIGGHMDTFSNGKPGADDDGSGTMVVMETLRVIAVSNARFERTIDFVWYAAEERGLVGSSFVVKHFTKNSIPVFAAIQFDMAGFNHPDDKEDIYVLTDYTNPDLTKSLKEIITTYTDAKVGETKCGYACSDHANWHRAGIPAVMPFEASFDHMNKRLHTADDKVEFLDKNHAIHFLKTALAFLGETAQLKMINGK